MQVIISIHLFITLLIIYHNVKVIQGVNKVHNLPPQFYFSDAPTIISFGIILKLQTLITRLQCQYCSFVYSKMTTILCEVVAKCTSIYLSLHQQALYTRYPQQNLAILDEKVDYLIKKLKYGRATKQCLVELVDPLWILYVP